MPTINQIFFSVCLALFMCSCKEQEGIVQVDNVDQVVSVFEQDLYYEQLTHDLEIDIDESLVSINRSVVLEELLTQMSEIVVLRISDQNCSLCVQTELEELEGLVQLLPESRIIVLASFDNKRGLKILTEGAKKLGVSIFSVRFDKVNLPIEEANIPYYFVLNSDWSVSNVFIPKKSFPGITNSYFAALSVRFQN